MSKRSADFWFRLAFRAAIEKYPCQRYSFALATYAFFDAAFGVGAPRLCEDCIKEYDDEEWKLVSKDYYDRDTQAVLEELREEWHIPRIS